MSENAPPSAEAVQQARFVPLSSFALAHLEAAKPRVELEVLTPSNSVGKQGVHTRNTPKQKDALKEFTKFTLIHKLPQELQDMIWKNVVEQEPRIVNPYAYRKDLYSTQIYDGNNPSPLKNINHQLRKEVTTTFGYVVIEFSGWPYKVLFHPQVDLLYRPYTFVNELFIDLEYLRKSCEGLLEVRSVAVTFHELWQRPERNEILDGILDDLKYLQKSGWNFLELIFIIIEPTTDDSFPLRQGEWEGKANIRFKTIKDANIPEWTYGGDIRDWRKKLSELYTKGSEKQMPQIVFASAAERRIVRSSK